MNLSIGTMRSLILINLGFQYYKITKDIEFFDNGVYQGFQSIIDYYIKGTLNNIYVDQDHLVFSGNKSTSTSWIPLLANNNDVLRFGKLLEVNALWFNALKILEVLSKDLGKKRKASKYLKLAEQVKESFNKTFVLKENLLADFVTNDTTNMDFRINQVVPLALPFSPLNELLKLKILSQIDKRLLTPYGLKSSKKKGDNSKTSNLNRKISPFYNGAIWPWTVGLYVRAALNCSDKKEEKALKLAEYFSPLQKLITDGLLNHLPEALSDTDSLQQSGIVDFAPSLSCLLWAYYELNKISSVQ